MTVCGGKKRLWRRVVAAKYGLGKEEWCTDRGAGVAWPEFVEGDLVRALGVLETNSLQG